MGGISPPIPHLVKTLNQSLYSPHVFACRPNPLSSMGTSPSRHYYPTPPPLGGVPSKRDMVLNTVPETSHSGARVVDVTFGPPMSPSSVLSSTVASQGPGPRIGGTRNWAAATRSMDGLHHTPPQSRREAPPYRWVGFLCLCPNRFLLFFFSSCLCLSLSLSLSLTHTHTHTPDLHPWMESTVVVRKQYITTPHTLPLFPTSPPHTTTTTRPAVT